MSRSPTVRDRAATKRYVLFRLGSGGRRELVSDTDLRKQAKSLPALYCATVLLNGVAVPYLSVDSATGAEVARHDPEEPFEPWVLSILGAAREAAEGRAA